MSIKVNGRTVDHVEGETVDLLLRRMKYSFPLVVVKVNGKLIMNNDYSHIAILDGAFVDVIHLTSGG